jgi:hypothetical protein
VLDLKLKDIAFISKTTLPPKYRTAKRKNFVTTNTLPLISDKNRSLESIKEILHKITQEAGQRKSNVDETSKEFITRLLSVLESVTQGLIHFYPFEYEDGQEILQELFDTWRETLMIAESCQISER